MRAVFEDVVVDAGSRQILRGGVEVRLSPRAFDLLLILLAHRPNVVSKAELHARLWPDTYVSDASLAMVVAEVRAALGDDAREPRYVRTLHRRGYAFQAEAVDAPTAAPEAPHCWLEAGGRQFPLRAGEHVIGRDPGVAVFLDDASVSRRHARLTVTADAVTVVDLGSKNGSRVGSERVRGTVALRDGDIVHIGGVRVVFRVWAGDPTETVTGLP